MHSVLRDFIHCLLFEARMPYSTAWQAELLKMYGIEIGEELGQGFYSTAYRARLKSGQPIVVKVSNNTREFMPYRRAMEARKSCPPGVAKHMPDIFLAISLDAELFGYPNEKRWSVVAMEVLRPLPAELQGDFFRGEFYSDAGGEIGYRVRARREQINVDILDRIARHTVEAETARLKHGNNARLLRDVSGVVHRGTSDAPPGEWRTGAPFAGRFGPNGLKSGINKIIGSIGDEVERHSGHIIAGAVVTNIIVYLRRAEFPTRAGAADRRPGVSHVPGIAGILRAVKVLSHIFPDLSWKDLHYNNLMVRTDGTIVISDFGMFGN